MNMMTVVAIQSSNYILLLVFVLTVLINQILGVGHCKRTDQLHSILSRNPETCSKDDLVNYHNWEFPNSFQLYHSFPIDPDERNFVRRVNNAIFSKVRPTPLKSKLWLVAYSKDAMANVLDLNSSAVSDQTFIELVGGTYVPESAVTLSHRYGGHQFGYWAGQLGDGRAVLIGEYVNRFGELWELQLKGSGKTPYSRQGDGRAVLRSSIREFLCSEAMHHLNIPTSRAVAMVVSDDLVMRDMFYDGHPQTERTAVVLRLAKSWFRIGSLEILEKSGETKLLKHVVDFVILNYFPSVNSSDEDKYVDFFWNVVNQTAVLMAMWQSVGFAHGVCNTDNFSLLSITIDYGPFGFLDQYDPTFVPNTSDDEARYSYEKQPDVGRFNMEKLQLAIYPLLTDKQKSATHGILREYPLIYKRKFMEIFRKKLGLVTEEKDDENLVAILLKMMEETKSDFTMTFRNLGEIVAADLQEGKISKSLWSLRILKTHKWFKDWSAMYVERFHRQNISDQQRQIIMNSVNPRYILRNWMAQLAIDKAQNNDFSEVQKVHEILTRPYTTQSEAEKSHYASKPPLWSKKLKVSCSS